MTKDELIRCALDALEAIAWSNNTTWQSQRAKIEVDAIREALAEQPAQQQNPIGVVAWAANVPNTITTVHWEDECPPIGTKLYTSPPASKPWVGLTLKETTDIELSLRQYHNGDSYDLSLSDYARAIEAKLREKNHG